MDYMTDNPYMQNPADNFSNPQFGQNMNQMPFDNNPYNNQNKNFNPNNGFNQNINPGQNNNRNFGNNLNDFYVPPQNQF